MRAELADFVQRDFLDTGTGVAQGREAALEGARDRRRPGRRACWCGPRRGDSRPAGTQPRVTLRAARISCATMASRTDRVMAQTVSSVVDRGSAPSHGVSRAVFLKPTMPHSAAGMRIEPPVSEPRPMKAAPVATDTAAPDDEPPGMRGTAASAGLAGRAVVRVDADARERELRHVGATQQGAAGGPQAGDGRAVRWRQRRIREHARAGRGGLAGDVEQVLDRHRQAGQRRGRGGRVRRLATGFVETGLSRNTCSQAGDWAAAIDASSLGGGPALAGQQCVRGWRARSVRMGGSQGGACYNLWVLLGVGACSPARALQQDKSRIQPNQGVAAVFIEQQRFRAGF